jgi:hypothetical protein
MAFCPTCRKSYDAVHTSGLCPTCGRTAFMPATKLIVSLTALVALLAVAYGIHLARGARFVAEGDRPGPPAPVPPAEFPAADAVIQPPSEWKFDRYSGDDVAFTPKLPPHAALRFRVVAAVKGPDAHLALVREIVPVASPADRTLPEIPGAEALAVSIAGDARVGASWIIPRGEKAIQLLFWGEEARLKDVPELWRGTTFR